MTNVKDERQISRLLRNEIENYVIFHLNVQSAFSRSPKFNHELGKISPEDDKLFDCLVQPSTASIGAA